MKLHIIAENLAPLLYRSDGAINDNVGEALRLIKSGQYGGQYFTTSMHDAALYYPSRDKEGWVGNLLVVRIANDLTTDGHPTDAVLLDDAPDYIPQAAESLRNAGAPEEIVLKFKQLASGQDGGDITHYTGTTSREKLEFLKEIFRYTGPEHLKNHGQVALLDRNLRANEFVDLIPYKITNGDIVFQNKIIPMDNAYRAQFE